MAYKVLLLGSGGVGTIASYTLGLHPDVDITTVVRSDYDRVSKSGYRIESVDYGLIERFMPHRIVASLDQAAAIGVYDYVVICTKNTPDISSMEEVVRPVVTDGHTSIVLMQNGIDIENAYFERYPNNIVLSGISMISSTNFQGVIKHVGSDMNKIGYFVNPNLSLEAQRKCAHTFVELYKTDRNVCVYDENVRHSRWKKLLYNATFNSICALTNVDMGRLEIFGGTDSLVRGAMKEVMAIAKSDGIELSDGDLEAMLRTDDDEYYAPSMLADVRKGNNIEVEVIVGNPIRIAQRNRVPTPILTVAYAMLQVVQKRISEERGRIVLPESRPDPSYRVESW